MHDEIQENQTLVNKALSCWYLTGATAVGKTAVSLHLAELLDAEIISLDSMSIYRGMDLGTAKPSLADRQRVPHHLIDVCDPNESFSVSQYRQLALETIDQIRGRGRAVLFVGGSALYLKALLRGLFGGPPADWDFRHQIEAELAQTGSQALHDRLRMIDPLSAHQLHPNDKRRIIRALEVYRATGQPISHWQMEFDRSRPMEQCRVFTLRRPRAELHQRIADRVTSMFESGFVDEVRCLLDQYPQLSHTALQAVGYSEVIHHLQRQTPLAEVHDGVLVRTRKFARHQETWFRGLSECQLIDIRSPNDPPEEIAQTLFDLGQQRQIES